MEKFLTAKFAILIILSVILLVVHELGHYLAYRSLGFSAVIRKSFLVPGIDPKETIEVTRIQGLYIALNGFILSTITVVFLSFLLRYQLWYLLLIGSIAGSCIDFIWAFSMLFKSKITINTN